MREVIGADAGYGESACGRDGLKVSCGGEARWKLLADEDVDCLLQLGVVMKQKGLLNGGVGEAEAQSCVRHAGLAADEPGVNPLDDPALEADHGKWQQGLGERAGVAGHEDLSSQGCMQGGRVVRIGRTGIRDEYNSCRFDDVAIDLGAGTLNGGGIGGDRIGCELHWLQRDHKDPGAGLGIGCRGGDDAELYIEVLLLDQIGDAEGKVSGNFDELAGGGEPMATVKDHGVGVDGLAGVRGYGIDGETLHDAEAWSAAEVGLPLQEVVLLALKIAAGKEATIKPQRRCTPAVQQGRAIAQVAG